MRNGSAVHGTSGTPRAWRECRCATVVTSKHGTLSRTSFHGCWRRGGKKTPSVLFVTSAAHLFSGTFESSFVVLGKTSGAIKSRLPFFFFPSVISDAFPRWNKIIGWTWKVDTDFIGWSFLPNEVWNRWTSNTCARVGAGLNTCSEIPPKGTDVAEFCYWFIHLFSHGRIKSSSMRSLGVSAKPCTSVINSKACLQRAPSLALRRGHARWTHSLISYSLSELCAVMNFSCA